MSGPDSRPKLILASASPYRAVVLTNAGIDFEAIAAEIDERAVEAPLIETGMDAADIAGILALAKAMEVSERYPGRYVIGADQTLGLDGEMLPRARRAVGTRVRSYRGKSARAGPSPRGIPHKTGCADERCLRRP